MAQSITASVHKFGACGYDDAPPPPQKEKNVALVIRSVNLPNISSKNGPELIIEHVE